LFKVIREPYGTLKNAQALRSKEYKLYTLSCIGFRKLKGGLKKRETEGNMA